MRIPRKKKKFHKKKVEYHYGCKMIFEKKSIYKDEDGWGCIAYPKNEDTGNSSI